MAVRLDALARSDPRPPGNPDEGPGPGRTVLASGPFAAPAETLEAGVLDGHKRAVEDGLEADAYLGQYPLGPVDLPPVERHARAGLHAMTRSTSNPLSATAS